VAVYWLVGGKADGDGRLVEDRGATDESVLFRDDSWKYGRGYYVPDQPIRYVESTRGLALVLRYVGESPPDRLSRGGRF
jgi:hypothetical protein